jgi:hypothetical protein
LGGANPRLNLTATVSLRARDQHHHAEACDLPTPVYGWFIEDLRISSGRYRWHCFADGNRDAYF